MKEENIIYYPDKEDFLKLVKNINILTVYRKILADTETPISAFQKIGIKGLSYLLESADGSDKLARYSFIGVEPFLVFHSKDTRVEIKTKDKKEVHKENPFLYLRRLFTKFKTSPIKGLPRFFGGGVGYFGYDLVRFIEELPKKVIDDLNIPDCILIFAGIVLVFDHLTHQMWIIANIPLKEKELYKDAAYKQATIQIEKIISQLKNPGLSSLDNQKETEGKSKELSPIRSNVTQEEFIDKVKKVKEYILAGDTFQVVLSQRFNRKTKENPFKIYRSLRSLNPSPYMYYLNYGKIQVVGASPEPLVRLTGELVESKPIAGTRPRGKNEVEDVELEKDMSNDEKEKAEHTMLVDLARNDLGRICCPGTVKVTNFMKVEKFSHVMHLVSEVEGKIQPNKNAFDALEACFPAGTVSGAPKVRAMEIIDELEPNYRGPYAGAVGYFSYNGNSDFAITIRTLVVNGNNCSIQVGGGIVADSIPEREWFETEHKAQALMKALKLAEGI